MARDAKRPPAPAVGSPEQPHEQAQPAELVPMVRDAEQFPPPHRADVHPAEVENYASAGWRPAP